MRKFFNNTPFILSLCAIFIAINPAFSKEYSLVDRIIEEFPDNDNQWQRKKTRYKVIFDPDSNTLKYSEARPRGGGWKTNLVRTYNLSDKKQRDRARDKVRWNRLIDADVFDDLGVFKTENCAPLNTAPSGLMFDEMNDVLRRLYEQHLETAISKRPIILSPEKMMMEVNVLDQTHRVQIEFFRDGRIKGLSFEDKDKAFRQKLSLHKYVDEDGRTYFRIEGPNADGDGRSDFLAFYSDTKKKPIKLVALVQGKEEQGLFNYKDFEKSEFDLDFDSRGLEKVGRRKRFTAAQESSAVGEIDKGGEGGVENFFFKLFFSKNGRREFVRDEIVDQGQEMFGEGKEYDDLLTDQQVRNLADDISRRVGERTNNFKEGTSKIKAVAMEESVKSFVDIVLQGMLKEMVADASDKDIKSIVEQTTADTYRCLEKASAKQNDKESENCLAHFMKVSPIKVGRGILLSQLKANGIEHLLKDAERVYNRCINEEYQPLFNGNTIKKEGTDTNPIIQSCLFESVFVVSDKAIPSVIEQEMKALKDKGLDIKLSLSQKKSAVNEARQCLKESGYMRWGVLNPIANRKKLGSENASLVINSFNGCINKIKDNVGKSVVTLVLSDASEKFKELPKKQKGLIIRKVTREGYDQCRKRQFRVIKGQSQQYEKEIRSKGTSSIKVAAFEPSLCASLTTISAIQNFSDALIDSTIGETESQAIVNKGAQKKYRLCFDRLKKSEMQHISSTLISAKKDEAAGKKHEEEVNRKSAACLQEAILWAVENGSGSIIQKIIDDSKGLESIKIGPKEKKQIGNYLKACFEKGLKDVKDPMIMGDAVEKVKDTCGTKFLKEKFAQDILFKPVIADSLKDTGLKGKDLEQLEKEIISQINERIKPAQKIDDVMAAVDDYKKDAIYHVIDRVIDVNTKSESVAKYLSPEDAKKVHSTIVNEELKRQLVELGKIKDPEKQAKAQNALVFNVKTKSYKTFVDTLMPNVFEQEAPVPKSLTESDQKIYLFKRNQALKLVQSKFNQCLDTEIAKYKKSNKAAPEQCVNLVARESVLEIMPLKIQEGLKFATTRPEVLYNISEDAKAYYKQCTYQLDVNMAPEMYSKKLEVCLADTIYHVSDITVDELVKIGAPIIGDGKQLKIRWKACLVESQNKMGQKRNISRAKSGNRKQFLDDMAEVEPLDMQGLASSLANCGITAASPGFLKDYQKKFLETTPGLTFTTMSSLSNLVRSADEVLSYRNKQGEPLYVDLLLKKEDSGVAVKAPVDEEEVVITRDTGLIQKLIDQNPLIKQYLQASMEYDPETFDRQVKELKEQILKYFENKKGRVKLKELNGIIARSSLVDTVIKALIGENIKEIMPAKLKEQGVDPNLIHILADASVIDQSFNLNDPKVKKLFKDIKEGWLLKFLNGELRSDQLDIPEETVNEATKILLSNTDRGAFAETLMGAIVQKKLDEKKAGIETGFFRHLKMAGAGLYGLQTGDFTWGYEGDGNPNNLRYQPSGQKAVKYFADQIALPMVTTGLDSKEQDKREDVLTDIIMDAMRENKYHLPW